jgi:hypothetical protein
MPRSPTMIIFSRPKAPRTASTASGKVFGSPVFPANTRTATGRPSLSVSSPYSICFLPRLPSRECPKAASSQHEPSTHELDRSNMAIPPSSRCRPASCFSMSSCRAASQSMAAYTSSVEAPATPRSAPRVTSCHQLIVDSLDAGRSTRETTSA